jgi:hypothetical protein
MKIKLYVERLRTRTVKVITRVIAYVCSIRTAALNGGLHEEGIFGTYQDIDLLYIGKPSLKTLIFKYDILFIPFHIDQIFLNSLKKLLEKFVSNGGILVALGATTECRRWIPFCQWNSIYPKKPLRIFKPSELQQEKQKILLGFASLEDLKYHGIFYSHGTLEPPTENTDKLIVAQDDSEVVMLITRKGRGVFFVTTLDPDFHAVTQVPGRTEEDSSKNRENAKRLLFNIHEWAKSELKGKELNRLWRKIKWFWGFSWYHIKFFLLLTVPTIIGIIIICYSTDKPELEKINWSSWILTVYGLLSSGASIVSLYKQNQAETKPSS